MQQTISILNTKVHPKWGKNWKLRFSVVSVSVVRNTSLSFTTATKTERGNKKGAASKHFNNENVRETSTPDLCLLELKSSNTDSSCHSITTLVWGLVWVIGGGFLVWFLFLYFPLLLSLRHSTTPAGYKLWWARSTTLRAQTPFLICQEII